MNGKFQGVITATTPTGMRWEMLSLPVLADGRISPVARDVSAARLEQLVLRGVDLVARLAADGARLANDDVGDLGGSVLDQPLNAAEQASPLLVARRSPCRLGAMRGFDGAVDVGALPTAYRPISAPVAFSMTGAATRGAATNAPSMKSLPSEWRVTSPTIGLPLGLRRPLRTPRKRLL